MQLIVKPQAAQRAAAEQLRIGRSQQPGVKQQGRERPAQCGQVGVFARRQVVRGLDITCGNPRQAEQNHIGVGDYAVQRRPQPGQQRVVGIQKQHPFAACRVQPGIAGCARAAVFAVQGRYAWGCGGQLVTKRPGVIGVAVVHQQDLYVGGSVCQGTCYGAAQRGRSLITGDDDGNVTDAHLCSSRKIVS